MTICNMTIEGGGRAGMIAPDETTFEWMQGLPAVPEDFDAAVADWRRLPTEHGAGVRHGDRGRCGGNFTDGHLGHDPGPGRRGHRRGPLGVE